MVNELRKTIGRNMRYADMNDRINGVGYTDNNNLTDYITNIGMGIGTNYGGTLLGNRVFGSRNSMFPVGRSIMNGFAESVPYVYNYFKDDK